MSASEPSPRTAFAILGPNAERSAKRRLGAREERGIGGLPPAQLVGEAELRQQCRRRVAAPAPGPRAPRAAMRRCRRPLPRAPDLRARRERPTTMLPSETRRGRRRRAPRGRARPQSRRPRGVPYAVSRRVAFRAPSCVPCARSPGWASPRTGTARGTRSRSRRRRRRSMLFGLKLHSPRASLQDRRRTRRRLHGARCP